jgi:inorganic pyrophosphatase
MGEHGMGKINATHYEDIPTYPGRRKRGDRRVHAIVETPQGSPHKYALDSKYGILSFHDVLPAGMQWPFDYGFIPRTLAADGDPVDVLVISERGLFSGCLIKVRVIGAVRESKDGVENDRVVAVPLPSPGAPQPTDAYTEFDDVPQAVSSKIVQFLCDYSASQGHKIAYRGAVDSTTAMALIKKCAKAFK